MGLTKVKLNIPEIKAKKDLAEAQKRKEEASKFLLALQQKLEEPPKFVNKCDHKLVNIHHPNQ